jgi:GntR family transcriptional regulator
MYLKIDPSSGVPIYLQIIEGVKLSIAAGVLKPDDQLPSVRQLAQDVRVNPNTVAKAYNEMERDGIIQTRRGEGTFVSSDNKDLAENQRSVILQRQIEELVETATRFNISRREIVQRIEERYRKFEAKAKG